MDTLIRKKIAGAMCLLSVFIISVAPAAGPTSMTGKDFREVVKKAKDGVFPAVVYVKCLRETHSQGKKKSVQVSGSGVLISKKGEILTNWHVVDKAVEIRCLLYDGSSFHAEVVGTDKDLDVALLSLKDPKGKKLKLPFAALGDSSILKEGDFVMAMGAPWGMARSVSIGIISCTRRFLEQHSEYSLWLQTDASISPGNSGGPLVNTAGEVIGLNTRGMSYGGDMGFAVPTSTISQILPRLRQRGDIDWSWTGLELQAIRDFNKNVYFEGDKGVIIAGTTPGSPARLAGVMDGDRVISINGDDVNGVTEEDLPAIRRILGLLPIDEPAKIKLLRDGKKTKISLTPRQKGKVEGEELDCPRWDLTVKAINQFDNKDLHFYKKKGVFIYGVKYPGNASNARLYNKDIILEIDGKKVGTLADVKKIHKETVANVETKPRIMFKLLRNGMMRQMILDFSNDFERE